MKSVLLSFHFVGSVVLYYYSDWSLYLKADWCEQGKIIVEECFSLFVLTRANDLLYVVSVNEYPKIYVNQRHENTTVEWLRNCSKLLPGGVEVTSNNKVSLLLEYKRSLTSNVSERLCLSSNVALIHTSLNKLR